MTYEQREAGLTQAEADAEIHRCSTEGCENMTEPCHAYCRSCEEASHQEWLDDETDAIWARLNTKDRVKVCKHAGVSIFAARRYEKPDDHRVESKLLDFGL